MSRVVITLGQDERKALIRLALSELRSAPDQARYLLRQELQRRGLLAVEPVGMPLESEEQSDYASTK